MPPSAAGNPPPIAVAVVELVFRNITETDSEYGSFRVWFLLLNTVTVSFTYVAALHLKSKTAGYFLSKMSLFRIAEELQFGMGKTGQTTAQARGRRGGLLLSR